LKHTKNVEVVIFEWEKFTPLIYDYRKIQLHIWCCLTEGRKYRYPNNISEQSLDKHTMKPV